MTIIEFLEARIAEDEAQAEKASVSMHGQKHVDQWDYSSYILSSERDSTPEQDEFVAEWWPARVLAECAANRAIFEVAVRLEEKRLDENLWSMDYVDIAVLAPLAAIHSDHPDYQQEWAA